MSNLLLLFYFSSRQHYFMVSPVIALKHRERWTTTTHNACRHCRIRFNASVGQPFSKQLYNSFNMCMFTYLTFHLNKTTLNKCHSFRTLVSSQMSGRAFAPELNSSRVPESRWSLIFFFRIWIIYKCISLSCEDLRLRFSMYDSNQRLGDKLFITEPQLLLWKRARSQSETLRQAL